MKLDLEMLTNACRAGGSSNIVMTTELEPAAGPHATVAPARFVPAKGDGGVYAYETRYVDGEAVRCVLIDSKQSNGNRVEDALRLAIEDGQAELSRMPRIEVRYTTPTGEETYTDLQLPHRAFDGHIRAGKINGTPATQVAEYQAARNASPADASGLLALSPVSLVLGSWDSSRRTRQGRWRSALVGDIIGVVADQTRSADGSFADTPTRGGARVDPVAMQVNLDATALQRLIDDQADELSTGTIKKLTTEAKKLKDGARTSASPLGLGGIPPTLNQLGGVACTRIIRSAVLSFAALRQIRFGAGPDGDATVRALLAALALNGLVRSNAELNLRANCDLVEAGPTKVLIDRRGGRRDELDELTIADADALLSAALEAATARAAVDWNGQVLTVTGEQSVIAGADDDNSEK